MQSLRIDCRVSAGKVTGQRGSFSAHNITEDVKGSVCLKHTGCNGITVYKILLEPT